MVDLLFAYGTLQRNYAAPEIAPVVRKLRRVGAAKMPGKLLDLGEYPAAVVADGDHNSFVFGEVYELPADPQVLRRIDSYEGFDPARPLRSLFRRRRKLVTLKNGRRMFCWVYLYNRKPGAAGVVPHGSYARLRSRHA